MKQSAREKFYERIEAAPLADGRGLGSGAILKNARLDRREKIAIGIKNGCALSGSNYLTIFLSQLWLFNKPEFDN